MNRATRKDPLIKLPFHLMSIIIFPYFLLVCVCLSACIFVSVPHNSISLLSLMLFSKHPDAKSLAKQGVSVLELLLSPS